MPNLSDRYKWLVGYISYSMSVTQENAKQIYLAISNDSDCNSYTPSILMPLIHYLVYPWQGIDCAYRISYLAIDYGLKSIYPLGRILQTGLASTYIDLLRKEFHRKVVDAEIIDQAAEARWLAAVAINDLRKQAIKRNDLTEDENRCISDAWSLACRLLNDVNDWKKECNLYYPSAVAITALSPIREIERILHEIANR